MCDKCSWEELVKQLESMTEETDDFNFALETLYGILETTKKMQHATQRMRTAVKNIYQGGMKFKKNKEEEDYEPLEFNE